MCGSGLIPTFGHFVTDVGMELLGSRSLERQFLLYLQPLTSWASYWPVNTQEIKRPRCLHLRACQFRQTRSQVLTDHSASVSFSTPPHTLNKSFPASGSCQSVLRRGIQKESSPLYSHQGEKSMGSFLCAKKIGSWQRKAIWYRLDETITIEGRRAGSERSERRI